MNKTLLALLYIFSLGVVVLVPSSIEKTDQIKVRVHPRMGIAPLRNVMIMVEIKNPEKFWCPSIQVEWWEGNSSTWEEDCEPLEENEKAENIYKVFRLPSNQGFGITSEILIWIRQGKHSHKELVQVIVAGS